MPVAISWCWVCKVLNLKQIKDTNNKCVCPSISIFDV
jgi:hypothetical protein